MSTGAVIGIGAVVVAAGVGVALYVSSQNKKAAALAALSKPKSGGGLSFDKVVSTAGSVAAVGSKIVDLFS
jgi:hypothetical protein